MTKNINYTFARITIVIYVLVSVFVEELIKLLLKVIKEYLELLNRLYDIAWFLGSLCLTNREAVYEKCKLLQTRLNKYNLFKYS